MNDSERNPQNQNEEPNSQGDFQNQGADSQQPPPQYDPYAGYQNQPPDQHDYYSNPQHQYPPNPHYPPQQQYPPYQQPYPGYPNQPQQASGQSKFGIVGIGFALLSFLAIGISMLLGNFYEQPAFGEVPDTMSPIMIISGLLILAPLPISFIGLIITFFGFTEKGTGKALVWISLLLNGILVILCGGFCVLSVVLAFVLVGSLGL